MRDLKFFNALKIILKDHFNKLGDALEEFKTFENIWNNFDSVVNTLNLKTKFNRQSVDIDYEFEKILKRNVKIITINDENYPDSLREIYMPPLGLYIEGDVELLNKGTNLAVIGSRNATEYGKEVVAKLLNELLGYKVTIIGGLARGIDTCAHTEALMNNLKTVAFIGSGFNRLYPKENAALADSIVENGGAIVSEYPLDFYPEKYYFVARNRLISGVSKAVLIVEAKKRGGSLITAKFAMEQNRDILVVPNSIFAINSEGTNSLIKDGAKLVDSGKDIITELGLKDINNDMKTIFLNERQKIIINLFEKQKELDANTISNLSELTIPEIISELTILELSGILKPTKNNQYIKIV
jgi:DNA processing protein